MKRGGANISQLFLRGLCIFVKQTRIHRDPFRRKPVKIMVASFAESLELFRFNTRRLNSNWAWSR